MNWKFNKININYSDNDWRKKRIWPIKKSNKKNDLTDKLFGNKINFGKVPPAPTGKRTKRTKSVNVFFGKWPSGQGRRKTCMCVCVSKKKNIHQTEWKSCSYAKEAEIGNEM